MQVLCQNANGAHDRLANIKVFGSFNDSVDYEVDLPAEHLVQRLALTRLRDDVPRQNQLSVGALKHYEEYPQHKREFTFWAATHTHTSTTSNSGTFKLLWCFFISLLMSGAEILLKCIHFKLNTNIHSRFFLDTNLNSSYIWIWEFYLELKTFKALF